MNPTEGNSKFTKNVVEDIVMPGMIVRDGAAKPDNLKIRFQMFTIAPGDDENAALHLEALLNREDIVILDYHKFPYQNNFNIAITYSEPKVPETKKV